jgi:hypothetical protein
MHLRFEVTHRTRSCKRSTPMLRTLGKTVGSTLAMLCLVATLAVAADEKQGMEMTCVKTDGNCVPVPAKK